MNLITTPITKDGSYKAGNSDHGWRIYIIPLTELRRFIVSQLSPFK